MSIRSLITVGSLACGMTLAGVLPQHTANAQVEVAGNTSEDIHKPFFVDAISFAYATPPQSRLDVFILVGYESLTFVNHDNRYDASYEVTVSLQDSSNALVNEKTWSEEVRGITFDESVSSSGYSLTQRVFVLTPGRYQLTVTMIDKESKLSRRYLRQVAVSDFAHPEFSLSDIMLVSKLSLKGEKKSITPNVSPNVGDVPGAFYAYFEVYNRMGLDSVRLNAAVVTEKGEQKFEFDTLETLHAGRNEKFIRINHSTFPLGDYRLLIRAYPVRSAGVGEAPLLGATLRPFMVRWQGLPTGVNDIDLAIDQLRYIAKDSEMSSLKEAKTPEEKQAKFLEFWKKRDPNPNTPRNERMEEYYARVEYANKHFKHYIEGWRTDMGMVFIIFGAPNDVSRHPFEIDSKPYEIWRYYGMNYDFVFVDETGFGDYRLTSPLWEVWQRPRD